MNNKKFDGYVTWINVNNELPDNSRSILIYSKDGGIAEGCYICADKQFIQFRWSCKVEPTHWAELPDRPFSEVEI